MCISPRPQKQTINLRAWSHKAKRHEDRIAAEFARSKACLYPRRVRQTQVTRFTGSSQGSSVTRKTEPCHILRRLPALTLHHWGLLTLRTLLARTWWLACSCAPFGHPLRRAGRLHAKPSAVLTSDGIWTADTSTAVPTSEGVWGPCEFHDAGAEDGLRPRATEYVLHLGGKLWCREEITLHPIVPRLLPGLGMTALHRFAIFCSNSEFRCLAWGPELQLHCHPTVRPSCCVHQILVKRQPGHRLKKANMESALRLRSSKASLRVKVLWPRQARPLNARPDPAHRSGETNHWWSLLVREHWYRWQPDPSMFSNITEMRNSAPGSFLCPIGKREVTSNGTVHSFQTIALLRLGWCPTRGGGAPGASPSQELAWCCWHKQGGQHSAFHPGADGSSTAVRAVRPGWTPAPLSWPILWGYLVYFTFQTWECWSA